MPIDLPILTVPNVAAWRQWLARESEVSKGVCLILAKKGVTEPTSLNYDQALDEALCHGWIDGWGRSMGESTTVRRFTPRLATSRWSLRNTNHITRLDNEGRMQPRGLREVEKAKADGRWDAAYGTTMLPSPELLAAIAAAPDAQAAWDTLNHKNRYAINFRLGALKTEAGRQKRIKAFVDMLERGETLYPQKQPTKSRKGSKQPTKVSGRIAKAKPATALISQPQTASRRSRRLQKP